MIITREGKGRPLSHLELDNNFRICENLKGCSIPTNDMGVDGDYYSKIRQENTINIDRNVFTFEKDDDNDYYCSTTLGSWLKPSPWIISDGNGYFNLWKHDSGEIVLDIHPPSSMIIQSTSSLPELNLPANSVLINGEEFLLNDSTFDFDNLLFSFKSFGINSIFASGLTMGVNITFRTVQIQPRADYVKEKGEWIKKPEVQSTFVKKRLPPASLDYFGNIIYIINDGIYMCISNIETPTNDNDCNWLQV